MTLVTAHGPTRSTTVPHPRKGDTVSATVLYMSMSLDGFIAGPNAGLGNGLGDGGHRLHEWLWSDPEPNGCRVSLAARRA